jgi:peptidyl-prolyl cis-trans isomerase SurA
MRALFTGLLIITSAFFQQSNAQIDSIVAVVDKDTIFLSDVDEQYKTRMAIGETDDGNLKCAVLEDLITNSILINKAAQKNIKVCDKEVDTELDKRIETFLSYFNGDKEKLETFYGETIPEIRSRVRPDMIQDLVLKKMKDKILRKARVSKKYVKHFFEESPKDSLPFIDEELEVCQIIKYSSYSEQAIEEVQADLMKMSTMATSGEKDFGELAKQFSMDRVTAPSNGALPEFGRGEMIIELENVVFDMEEGEISAPFKTRFGYSIVKLHKRVDNQITASHILIVPKLTMQDKERTYVELKRIKTEILTESIPFEKAAKKWSDDPSFKSNGGYILNTQTGRPRIPSYLMDVSIFLALRDMKEGEISEPIALNPDAATSDDVGYSGARIVYLKKRIEGHTANLREDYQKVSDAALNKKRDTIMDKWVTKAKKTIYIDIKDEKCADLIK